MRISTYDKVFYSNFCIIYRAIIFSSWFTCHLSWNYFFINISGITSQVLNEVNYLDKLTRVQIHPNISEEKVIQFDLYKKQPRKPHKRSLWDGCSLKLYSRQYYQGNEIRYDRSQRQVRNNHYPKSIKTFGKCCWRIFW